MAYEPGHTLPPSPVQKTTTGSGLGFALAIVAVLAIIAIFAFGMGGGPSATQDAVPQPYGTPAEPDAAAPADGTAVPDTGLAPDAGNDGAAPGVGDALPPAGETGGADPAPQPQPAPAD